MDNRQFNVNGRGKEMLAYTLKLALANKNCYGDNPMSYEHKANGYVFSKKHGLMLLWSVNSDRGEIPFMTPLGPDAIASMLSEWLESEQAKSVELDGWDRDADHDGDNEKGWRVFCQDWGHVDNNHYAIVAVKPVYLWYGK